MCCSLTENAREVIAENWYPSSCCDWPAQNNPFSGGVTHSLGIFPPVHWVSCSVVTLTVVMCLHVNFLFFQSLMVKTASKCTFSIIVK